MKKQIFLKFRDKINRMADLKSDLRSNRGIFCSFMAVNTALLDEWIILGWICRRWDVGIWTGLGWPRIETGGGRL